MPCYSPLKGYKDPSNGGLVFTKTSTKMEVACSQCLGCRLDRTVMWAMRIVHESYMHVDNHGNCFISLTYRSKKECSDEQFSKGLYVPSDYSLDKTHFQKFLKRLRQHFPQKIRYFHCGEYGDENLRPHYHACLFNCTFDDQVVYENKEGLITYTSETLEDLWSYGFATVGDLTFHSAAYVAGYILKKVNGKQAKEAYLRNDEDGVAYWVVPPYVTMSLGRKYPGGIGADFYEKYKTDFVHDETPVPGLGVRKKIPRYYEKIMADSEPKTLENIKALRQMFINAHRSDFTPERLKDKYKCAQFKQSTKKRNL